MKKLNLFFFGIGLFVAGALQAQVSVNINLGSPPQWGPAGYTDVRYYYLPDVESYYDVHSSMFIYLSGGRWIQRSYLPTRYRNYDLYQGYKVVMPDYRGNTPYTYYKEHKIKYAKGYHGGSQKTIGHGPERGNSKAYQQSKSRTYSNDYQKQNQNERKGNDKGSKNGNSKGKGKK